MVAPVIDYWQLTIEVKKGVQVERMKRVRIFNPLQDIQVGSAPSDYGADGLVVEGKLYKDTSIHLRVACSAH